MKVRNYQDLIAWQKAMDLVEDVYQASRSFPKGGNLCPQEPNKARGGFCAVEYC